MEPSSDVHQRIAAGLSRIGLVLRHHAQGAARTHRLTPLQAQALGVLRGRPDGLRVRTLARELAVTDATVSDAVSTLVSKRLVAKRPDPEDHRAVRLSLTGRGGRIAEEAALWPDFLREALGELPASDVSALLRVLVGLIRALERSGEIPVSRMCVSCRYFSPNRYRRGKPHHCGFIDAPIGTDDIRFDCPDFEETIESAKDRNLSIIRDDP